MKTPTRKTIRVANIRNRMNKILDSQISRDAKMSMCCIIEDILMQTGNYRGFKWNMSTEEAREVAPGDDTYYNRYYF